VQDNQRASKRLDLPALLAAEPGGLSSADFNEVAKRAHMWEQFGLLTTEERRSIEGAQLETQLGALAARVAEFPDIE
jgi:hypothetical protein